MAYAALTSLAKLIHQTLQQDQRTYISICTKNQMKSLHENVTLLQDFLEYISLKPPLPAVDVLESRIRDTAYKMEDTIELLIVPEHRKYCCLQFLFYIFQCGRSDGDFSSYFEDVHGLLEEAMAMKQVLDKNLIPESLHLSNVTTKYSKARPPSSNGNKVGLDTALHQILDRVPGQGSMLRIVPITGMGGIGKTTLARACYEDPRTLHHFDVRFWVTVSQDYNVQEILRGLLPRAEQDDGRLIEYVYKHLKGRRYLIVLDDMWDEKMWDRVKNAFPDDNKGSRVILTTRSSRVASYVGSSNSVHEMQFLNEDQSWELLQENVYGHKNRSSEFEGIGRMIARNCKGLPLAVVVIAGLLKFNKTNRDYWEQVARNSDEKATTSNDHLFEILSWSYTRLPPHLKACFLYMGFYKEDYEIPTKNLVMLWAAEGFLKPTESRTIEDIAEECLEELVERSLVLVKRRWYNGKIRTCSVHDVLRDVSIRKAEEEKFHYHFTSVVDESTFRNVLAVQRRVSITSCSTVKFPLDTVSVTTHSLMDQKEYSSRCLSIVQCFKLLKVLNKTYLNDSVLSVLFTLTNLRYLHFICNYSIEILIPKSISKLQNLEILLVNVDSEYDDCEFVFPLDIWKLQRLRHFIVNGEIVSRAPLPTQGCPVLSDLQTLYWININFIKCFAEIFPNLKKLKGKYNEDEQDYTMDSLQYLHQLEELSLSWGYTPPTKLVFPQNLIKLSLHRTNLPLGKLSPIGLLPNLKVLKLKEESVQGREWEPNEGEFLQLEHLKLEDLDITEWRAESFHFPSLRELVIITCQYLKEVPESIGEIDTLEKLILKASHRAIRSVQKIKEDQQDMCNDLLQVTISDNSIW